MDAAPMDAGGSDPMELLVVQRHAARESFTRYRLQETLMLMGCRQRDAVEVTHEVFTVFHKFLARQPPTTATSDDAPLQCQTRSCNNSHPHPHEGDDGDEPSRKPRSLSTASDMAAAALPALPWQYLHQCVYAALARLDYIKPHHLLDLKAAKEITQRKRSFVVLLGGTSGTGKSTLASLLAARLRLTTVLPTDSVRHVLRAFTSKEENPCAFVSTYQAGDALSAEMVAELSSSTGASGAAADGPGTGADPSQGQGHSCATSAKRLHKRKVLRGYKMQSEVVLEKLDAVLTMFEKRQQSLVVEGVHLNTDQMLELVKRHPNCVPFMIYISNELKHRERFAVRARHMTIDPQENKYIKYFDNIRIIQRYLCKQADKYLIPKIDNTNVDRSIAAIQATLIRVLRKMDRGEKLVDDKINKMVLLSREHESSIKKAWSSKGVRKAMRPLIKQKVAKRLLLRRLLAEQNMTILGGNANGGHGHAGEDDSSSSDEDRAHDGDDDDTAEDGDEEDGQTTVVGSLFSGTNTRDHAATVGQGTRSTSGRVLLDDAELAALPLGGATTIAPSTSLPPLSNDSNSAKMMRSLSAAIQQAALWRARKPLSNFSDWEQFVVPSRSPDATFSEVMENIQSTPGYADMKRKWQMEERRKTWMSGDSADQRKALLSSAISDGAVAMPLPSPPSPVALPARVLPQSKSTRELETAHKHISFATQADSLAATPMQSAGTAVENGTAGAGATSGGGGGGETGAASVTTAAGLNRAARLRFARRVQSLPPDVTLDLSSLDYDFDSVSVAEHTDEQDDLDDDDEDDEDDDDDDDDDEDNDRISQSSSHRDECISPLGQSIGDLDSHFDVSSQGSNDGDDRM